MFPLMLPPPPPSKPPLEEEMTNGPIMINQVLVAFGRYSMPPPPLPPNHQPRDQIIKPKKV
jgi:hypothetical protein